MTPKKNYQIGCNDNKANRSNILKKSSLSFLIMIAAFIPGALPAQTNKDTTTSVYSASEDTYKQMLDYSRPGKYHQLLADLVGRWIFKGRHFEWTDSVTSKVSLEYSGTVVRESFANGRYFIVNVTSDGKLEMPVQEGKMKEVKFQGFEIEGYDNVKKKFVRSSIGNHLNSFIAASEGAYDSTTRTITFDSEFEPIPGMKTKDHFRFIFIDTDHYKWEVDQEEKGKYRRGSEIEFTRVKR
ncbi:DUF1579 domain-containing protein [Terrimonas sp. NA20]|uniref:DUF1579 domain-containing protein n=1 Tax=Terrimonas ginsenosidimutans TaxID=2908004 RepID=A0ABS9KMH2_9BACT|nr:DUF1579 family protein [Terrimonas ginsenosidimutans]MCG2613517.1 DUF1579 domain-containing protein [Terrimonas ginsenosidimutans]